VRIHITVDDREDKRGDLLIYLMQSGRVMENITIVALVLMLVFIGVGFAVSAMPMITEVSAQGNMTGNATGNYTVTGGDAGNISSLSLTP
jgi:hypothetical protein